MYGSRAALATGFGPFASPSGVIGVLLALAAVILVGRLLLSLAWRLVVFGLLALSGLYVLGLLGYGVGILG